MKRLFLIAMLAFLTSCDSFDKKKIDTETIVEAELKSIDWNDVDQYPTFTVCDAAENKKTCFENVLRDRLNQYLSQQNIVVTEEVNDTVILRLHIDNTGKFSIKEVIVGAVVKAQIPTLDSLLRHSLDSLPKMYPAVKRGQQVATEFNLPVLIH